MKFKVKGEENRYAVVTVHYNKGSDYDRMPRCYYASFNLVYIDKESYGTSYSFTPANGVTVILQEVQRKSAKVEREIDNWFMHGSGLQHFLDALERKNNVKIEREPCND